MTDYISRDSLIKQLGELPCKRLIPVTALCSLIKHFPAADVVEVVRCKDCKWCHSGYCEMYDDLIPFGCANRPWEKWFCADGTRMDGDS